MEGKVRPVGSPESSALTKDQLDFYHTEGYLILPDLLNDEDMEPPIEAMKQKVSYIADDLYAAGLITDKREKDPFESRLANLFRGLTDKDFLKFGRGWRDRLPGYFYLMSNPKIIDAAESIIGGEIFSNPVYNVRPKVPGVAAGAVPWHQDKSYWPGANANPVVTFWISMVDATEENGCLYLKPRTHRKRLLKWHKEAYSGTSYLALKDEQVGKTPTIALPVTAGTAIVFNDRCLHMSTMNRSEGVRWSVDLRYQPTDQDPMIQHGIGFLARSHKHPERVATLEDWLENRMDHQV